MRPGRKTATSYLIVLSGLVLALVNPWDRWPLWAWPASVVLLAVAPVAKTRIIRRWPVPLPRRLTPTSRAAPVEHREPRVSRVALPSRLPDYDFLFSADVRWRLTDPPGDAPLANPGGLAVEAVVERARKITELRDPRRRSLVEYELNGRLGTMEPDSSGCVLAMAEAVVLALPDHDQKRLDRLSAARKDEEVWEYERKREKDKRRYLAEDALKDAGSAVVWWLARNDDQVEQTVKDLGLLAQLSSAANNDDVPESLRHLVPHPVPAPSAHPENGHTAISMPVPAPTAADHFDAFLRAADIPDSHPQRALIARQVADFVIGHQRPQIADELRRRFDNPGASRSENEPAPPDADPLPNSATGPDADLDDDSDSDPTP